MQLKGDVERTQKYDIEELREKAETLFNVKPEVVAGALYDCGLSRLTTGQVKKLIKEFIKRRVK